MPYLHSLLGKKVFNFDNLAALGLSMDDVQIGLSTGELISPIQIDARGPVPGVYALAEAEFDPDLADCVITLTTGGIICLQSAAMRQHQTTSLRDSIDIYLPSDAPSVSPALNVTVHRSRRPETFEVGILRKPTDLGVDVLMTSPARTVVDLIRNKTNSLDDYRHGLYGIHTYLEDGGDIKEINDVAEAFGKRTADLIEIAVSTAYEGMTRRMGA